MYYVARIDAGTFTGVIPTNTSKWNNFGAQFESIATDLLLAENANIAGWVFKNNRLEAQNGSVYLDGVNGVVRVKGTMQLSTGFSGAFSDVNIFYLPSVTSTKYISMGQDADDIGKVCRLYNSSPFGGADYMIGAYSFTAEDGMSWSQLDYYAVVKPQEVVEMTCFEEPGSTATSKKGRWDITSRFSHEDFYKSGAKGRYARILAIGKINGTNSGASLSGTYYDGRSLSSVFSVSRLGTGKYRVYCSSCPSGYTVMATGYGAIWGGSNPVKACLYSKTSSYFGVLLSDDASANDGSCEFVIFAPDWDYNMK